MKWGGSSARSAIYAIANHANDDWFCWAKQETLAFESEQSLDSIQRRIQEFIDLGRVRRIKLKRFGRRTHDFLILRPSPYFTATLEEIEPFIPRGCDIMAEPDAAADCGSLDEAESSTSSPDSTSNAAADCGSVETAETGATLPQPAVHATALVRQQEPLTNQDSLPDPSQPERQALKDWIEKFKSIYPGPCNHPEDVAEIAAGLTDRQREQCMRGAEGAAEIARRQKNTKGLFGHLRFIRSEPLWAEYGKSAPTRTGPVPRVWVMFGSDDWRARAVLYAIIGKDMPAPAEHRETSENGADFIGALPPAGLVLAPYADAYGEVRKREWVFLNAPDDRAGREGDLLAINRDRPKLAAWNERVKECLGVSVRAGVTDLPFPRKIRQPGTNAEIETKFGVGLWVPCDWPPKKGVSTGPPHKEPSQEDLHDFK